MQITKQESEQIYHMLNWAEAQDASAKANDPNAIIRFSVGTEKPSRGNYWVIKSYDLANGEIEARAITLTKAIEQYSALYEGAKKVREVVK